MPGSADRVPTGSSGDVLPIHAEKRRAHVALPVTLLVLLVLGVLSFVAGELLPRPLPTRAAFVLRVSSLVVAGGSLATLATWGAHAAFAHVSAKLSRWLDGARPAVAEMSVFVAAYLVAASQRRGSMAPSPSPPPPFCQHDGGRGLRTGGDNSGSWRRVVGVVFTPEWARTSGAGGVGPPEGEVSARSHREIGNKKIVPSSP